jgi:hypothetical protein
VAAEEESMARDVDSYTSWKRGARARLGGLLRVSLLLLATGLISATWLMVRARAQLGERAIILGRSTAEALFHQSGTTDIVLNGQRLSLNATSTELPVRAVLDRFVAQCDRADGGMQRYLDELRARQPRLPGEASWSRLTLFRTERDRDGTAACVARTPGDQPLADLAASLAASVEHEDLARLGQFRYVFARKSPTTGLTQVISVWNRGPLKLLEMAPDGRDVPGGDLVHGVRPAKSQRVARVEAEGSGFEASLYESSDLPEQTLASYDAALRARGYVPIALPEIDGSAPVPVRVYTMGGRDPLLALALPTEAGSLLSAFRIGANGSL